MQILYAQTIAYTPAAYFTKVTLLLLISNAFDIYGNVAILVRAVMSLLLLGYIPIFFIKIFICRPIASYWDERILEKHCFNQSVIFVCISFLNVATDFFILVLPMFLAWSLNLTWQKKAQIVGVLSMGGFAAATTVATA